MIMLKKWFVIMAFLASDIHLSASQGSNIRDTVRRQIFERASFYQQELRQMAGIAGIIGSMMVVKGICRYLC